MTEIKRSPERVAPELEEDDEAVAAAEAAEKAEDEAADAKLAAAKAAKAKDGEDEGEGETDQVAADSDPGDEDDDTDEAVERRARAMGWRPKSEWRGDARKWRPAREYLDKAYANRPVFDERMDQLTGKIGELEGKLGEATDVLKQMSKREITAWDRGYKARQAEILAAKDQAIEDGDKDGVKAAEKKLEELEEERATVVPKADEATDDDADKDKGGKKDRPAQPPAEVQAFAERNSWWGKDDELSDFAMSHEKRLLKANKDMPLAERLKAVEKEVRRRYPEKFQNARREAPTGVAAGGRSAGSGKKGRTVGDLPQDAKDYLAKLKRTIPGYKDSDYLKTYEWED